MVHFTDIFSPYFLVSGNEVINIDKETGQIIYINVFDSPVWQNSSDFADASES